MMRSLRKMFRDLLNIQPAKSSRRPKKARLCVEALEERMVPSFAVPNGPLNTVPVNTYGQHVTNTTPVNTYGQQVHNTTPVNTYGQPVTNTTPVNTYGQQVHNTTPVNTYGQQVHNTTPVNTYGQQVANATVMGFHVQGTGQGTSLSDQKLTPQQQLMLANDGVGHIHTVGQLNALGQATSASGAIDEGPGGSVPYVAGPGSSVPYGVASTSGDGSGSPMRVTVSGPIAEERWTTPGQIAKRDVVGVAETVTDPAQAKMDQYDKNLNAQVRNNPYGNLPPLEKQMIVPIGPIGTTGGATGFGAGTGGWTLNGFLTRLLGGAAGLSGGGGL
jgi:hypothetical protein